MEIILDTKRAVKDFYKIISTMHVAEVDETEIFSAIIGILMFKSKIEDEFVNFVDNYRHYARREKGDGSFDTEDADKLLKAFNIVFQAVYNQYLIYKLWDKDGIARFFYKKTAGGDIILEAHDSAILG